MLITIADYCAQRNVSKQFVYEYIKKGKLTVLELPTFIEFKGEKVQLGMQKMLDVPEPLIPKASDKKTTPPMDFDNPLSLTQFIEEMTDEPFLKDVYYQVLSCTDVQERKVLKKKMYETIDASPNKEALRASIDEVNIKLMQYMRRMGSQMQDILAESRQAVKGKEQLA
jgi:hypothetical protein